MEKTTKSLRGYFTKAEIVLWCASVGLIIASFCVFDRSEYMARRYGRHIIYLGRDLLCHVPCQRYLRIYKLVTHEKTAIGR